MARILTDIVLDLRVDEARCSLFGGLRWGSSRDLFTVKQEKDGAGVATSTTLREVFSDRVELRPTQWFGSDYPTTAAWFGTYLRAVPAVKAWRALEVLADTPTGTQVLYLLADEDGDAYRWDGASWSPLSHSAMQLGSNWNSEAQLQAGFPTWPGTSVQVLFRMRSLSGTATPVVYGARAMAQVWVPSAVEDVLLDTVVPALRAVQVPVRLQVSADGDATVDLGGLRTYAFTEPGSSKALFVPVAAFDLTADPEATVDLMASWNSTTKVLQLSSTPTAGHTLQVEALVNPLVARHTSADHLELARLPAVVLENVTIRIEPSGQDGVNVVRDRAGGLAWEVDPPTEIRVTLDLVAVAGYDVDVQRLLTALDNSRGAAFSQVTGEPVYLRRTSNWIFRDAQLDVRSPWEAVVALSFVGQARQRHLMLQVDVDAADSGR